MKKTFLVKRNALLSGRSISWGALALVSALFMLMVRLLAPNFFWQAFTPVSRVSNALTNETHAFLSSFGDTAALSAQNEKLTSENVALATQNQALLQKSTNLSALIGTSASQKNSSGILAGVVARPPVSPYDILVLSVGANDGVSFGMEAFGDGGVPVGIVSSVFDNFSRVTLFSAPSVITDGWVGHTNIPLTLVGAGAGAMQASAARAANIAIGDIVFVPGPGALPIGSVVRIDSDPLSPSVTLRIRPAVNPFSLSWVELRETGVIPSTLATSTVP